jgi:hypothetical protein
MKQKLMLLLFTAIITQGFFSKVNAQYDKIYTEYEGMRKVNKNNKAGFINSAGTLVIPIEYDAANNFMEGLCAVQMKGKIGFIDKTNKLVIPFIFEGVGAGFQQGNCIIYGGKKSWMIDKTGRQTTARKYDAIAFNGRFGMAFLDNKWGFINLDGKEVIPLIYDYIYNIGEGLVGAKKDGKFGYIDTLNQTKIPFIYDAASVFYDGASIVSLDKKYGLIDKKGNAIIPFQYKKLYRDDSTGWYRADQNGKWGMIDKAGNVRVQFIYDFIKDFDEVNKGYAIVVKNEKFGLIDKTGKLIIKTEYDRLFKAKDGYCNVRLNEKTGVVELSSGKLIIDTKYDGIGNISEGIFLVKKFGMYAELYGLVDETYGYVNLNSKEITKIEYKKAVDFSNGMAAVKKNDKWGFINTSGKEVIKPKYDLPAFFKNGKAMVELDGEEFYIDKKGKKVK